MISQWTSNLKTDEEKKEFGERLKLAKPQFDRLSKILLDKLTALETLERNYDNPNWPYLVADTNGQKSVIKELLKLTTIA